MAIPVTAIFDIGKTNKKFFLFDDTLKEIHHAYYKLPLTTDDDGYACDDLEGLTAWIKETIQSITASKEYQLKGLNFSTYGATLVHLDKTGSPVTPLYNYLKPYPQDLLDDFYERYHEDDLVLETASPKLGMLNSGLQLYWLKKQKPDVFKNIYRTLHFPQYLSSLFTNQWVSEPTSIGCHTKLWDFARNQYHQWLKEENMLHLFPDLVPTTHSFNIDIEGNPVEVGVGIHDSSSALAAYLMRSPEPFLLVSTGTWSITLNPFTKEGLTQHELQRDCLNYLTIEGNPVKSSRLFLGNELDHQLKNLNTIFHKDTRYYKQVKPDESFFRRILDNTIESTFFPETIAQTPLPQEVLGAPVWNPAAFTSFEEAYHHVMWGLAKLQVASIHLALGKSAIRKIFIDGGFISNDIFIQLLRYYLPGFSIEVSDMPLGSAHGAAMVLKNKKAQILPIV